MIISKNLKLVVDQSAYLPKTHAAPNFTTSVIKIFQI